jgi:hypothetical protein
MIEEIFPRNGSDGYSATDIGIHTFYQHAVAQAIRQLLETKHLYQSVEVDNSPLITDLQRAKIELPADPWVSQGETQIRQDFLNVAELLASASWKFRSESIPMLMRRIIPPAGVPDNSFDLPTIKTICWKCKATLPHNSGYTGMNSDVEPYSLRSSAGPVQVFSVAYQCQGCKDEPLVFLIRRERLKLTLVGRSCLQEPLTPNCIPKGLRKYYAQALVAQNCNFTLAALFYLRVVVEQWMRLRTGSKGKLTGEELGDRYAATLPKVVSEHFPSLKKSYECLSDALHAAREDDGVFVQELQNIERHFDGLRVHSQ